MATIAQHQPGEHRFRHVGELQHPAGFDTPIRVSVGPDGPVALWAAADDAADLWGRYEVPGFASFAETTTFTQPPVALVRYSANSVTPEAVTTVVGLPVAHPQVQPLPGGDYLVVGARCRWSELGPEHNAMVIGDDGETKRTGTLGDAIAHLLVDDRGEIWTGYTDEGIFGNYGWGGDQDRAPLGSAGIVRWSRYLGKIWEYEAIAGYWPADCYTLNVGSDRVVACTYTDFPVVQIEANRTVVHPTTGVSGPYGLVIAGDTVGFIGDYLNRGSLYLGSIPGNLHQLTVGELRMPDGSGLPAGNFVCRGSVAHLFVGAHWFTFDLSSTLTGEMWGDLSGNRSSDLPSSRGDVTGRARLRSARRTLQRRAR